MAPARLSHFLFCSSPEPALLSRPSCPQCPSPCTSRATGNHGSNGTSICSVIIRLELNPSHRLQPSRTNHAHGPALRNRIIHYVILARSCVLYRCRARRIRGAPLLSRVAWATICSHHTTPPQAFVIYCFFDLLIAYLGGERSLLILLHGRSPKYPVFPGNLVWREVDVSDPYTFLFLKRGIIREYPLFSYILEVSSELVPSNLLRWVCRTGPPRDGHRYIALCRHCLGICGDFKSRWQ